MITIKRETIFQYVADKYQAEPQYLWQKYPTYAVLRHPSNNKWFALMMTVPAENLGLSGDKQVEVMDIKLDPENIELLQNQKGFLPAYHMNKSHWLSIEIDQVDDEQTYKLLDNSFDLTSD
ncbi:MmcQ/YjbR family DNA-binding protein [Companilactobacillus versmoldensis]|uniref:MmcQ protein n=1 Tax=Companilactobacillus versmoldensis DSM 14857 = KCTC 3814 TaxID=1423815 RepID=A0A0R1SQJ4_9LACO|nr:MmcQ/YjbR family DNA-binding protein [Companilactobacillus versmoldensis]KRL68472.1 hypothetical protein FC27_GL000170 [Companilactobacillus versmoldensis DSM 14857 = KCTC 3814]